MGAIVAAAGVAQGTFYFRFPSKEHVLLELECREEARIAAQFAEFLDSRHDLVAALAEVVRLVTALEERFGPLLTTTDDPETRNTMLAELVASAVRGLEIR